MTAEVPPAVARLPLVEVVFGVQFEELPQFTNAHLGAYWKQLGAEWPAPTDAAFLPPQLEKFGESEVWREFSLQMKLTSTVPTRLQVRKQDGSRMIQAQNGRFHYNWMGKPGEDNYPRYERVKEEFDAALAGFRAFVKEAGLGKICPNQWELTYINQILKGELWTTQADCGKIFRHPEKLPLPLRFGEVSGETFAVSWRGEIEPKRGRLYLDVQHGRLGSSSGPETITLTLTARGPATSDTEVSDGLNLGHVVIIGAFRDLVSDTALKHWGLTDANS